MTRWGVTANSKDGLARVTLPFSNDGDYDCMVDWGDGSRSRIPDPSGATSGAASWSHAYGLGLEEYTIRIHGKVVDFAFRGSADANKLLDVMRWGGVRLGRHGGQFKGCTRLKGFSAPDVPDLSGVTSMDSMFSGASAFAGDLSGWNTAAVTSMDGMFSGASAFSPAAALWFTGGWSDEQLRYPCLIC